MATEVLRPQDCLSQRIALPPPLISRRGSHPAARVNGFFHRGSRKPAARPEPRKRVDQRRQPSSDDSRVPRLVVGKVAILRRGESLDSNLKNQALKKQGHDLVVVGTQRLGPDPEMVPRQTRVVEFKPVYAGSAFAVSPSPSALPLPSFSRKQQQRRPPAVVVDDSATQALRRLLRLE
ncbi:hypothetical protein Fmac_009136 [Flemingia macrophylla]|uniref:Uncharacterized protein n=1 Tax=Flemingia macrophylla TaxID=520843 RepID=A0ABD1MZD8_9FABA